MSQRAQLKYEEENKMVQAAQGGSDSVSHEEMEDMLNNPLTALYN